MTEWDIDMAGQDIRSIKTIQTAEGVTLSVELAGVPARLVAYLLDTWLTVGAMLLCLGVIVLLGMFFSSSIKNMNWSGINSEVLSIVSAIMLLSFFFIVMFLQEWLWNGKTVGKTLMKIRVVRNNGQPIGFWEALGRNLFRLVDVYINGIGVLVMLFSPSEKRFGDYLAGTMVIADEPVQQHIWIKRSLLDPEETPETEMTASQITYEEKALLESFFNRSRDKQFFVKSFRQLEAQLRLYFGWRLQVSPNEAEAADFLSNLR